MLPFFYSYLPTPIGILRIKATERAIHEIVFVEEAADSDLHQPVVIQECRRQLEAYFTEGKRMFDVPLNPNGTQFQRHVWDQLILLPYGRTISYQEFARKTGDERNIRAIANAIGKNPLAVIVPCHRVIGSNGSLTGYAWGLVRKKWLIDLEAKTSGSFMQLF